MLVHLLTTSLVSLVVTGHSTPNKISILIDDAVVGNISDRFVSWTMDATLTGRWSTERDGFWYNPITRNLAKQLSPAFFRFGGTQADYTEYDFPTAAGVVQLPQMPPINNTETLNSSHFDAMVSFTEEVGWDFVFGVNSVTSRTSENAWDPAPFKTLLAYSKQKNVTMAGWELSNEDDTKCTDEARSVAFHCGKPANITGKSVPLISPQQLAKDFALFKEIILDGDTGAAQPMIIGADFALDFTRPKSFGYQYVDSLSFPLSVLTWHFYYGPGSSSPGSLGEANFSEPSVLDSFLRRASAGAELLKQRPDKMGEMWVGETSSTYGGGSGNLTESFVAGFMWLDKLGLAANLNQSVVCRQTFAHSSYAVVGEDNVPNPDYWTSILWRRLVGNVVLRVVDGLARGRTVRAYAFCARDSDEGDVTVAVLNTDDEEVEVDLSVFENTREGSTGGDLSMEAFLLTSPILSSRDVYLNGVLLQLKNETTGELPELKGVQVEKVVMPAKSYGFVVVKGFEKGSSVCAA
jgi:heparanase 1